ncbi:MAG: hypothetical protein LBO69_06605 [Ignavibacteria bacterium]|jgi:hypothetical protein|nr:hypothetical protein [Ignavibacteria bacterium]
MKIIDKNKDYYDYLQGINGIDPQVTFDRRGSFMPSINWLNSFIIPYQEPDKYLFPNINKSKIVLEVGFQHYILEIERMKDETCKYKLHSQSRDEHCGASVIGIYRLSYYSRDDRWKVTKETHIPTILVSDSETKSNIEYDVVMTPCFKCLSSDTENVRQSPYLNPILKDTFIPSIIDAQTIWNNIYEYISFTNEPLITDSMTDKEKLESKGFDNKSSFRHPVKYVMI